MVGRTSTILAGVLPGIRGGGVTSPPVVLILSLFHAKKLYFLYPFLDLGGIDNLKKLLKFNSNDTCYEPFLSYSFGVKTTNTIIIHSKYFAVSSGLESPVNSS